MRYDPEKYHRRSIRLKNHDYSQAGAYFITICTHNRECFLGDIVNGDIVLSDAGQIVLFVWNNLPKIFRVVGIDTFQFMPNHIHGIIFLNNAVQPSVGATFMVAQNKRAGTSPAPTLGEIVGAFKSLRVVFPAACGEFVIPAEAGIQGI